MVSELVLMRHITVVLTATVSLREPWNLMTQRYVPDLYIVDLDITSHIQIIDTRISGQRGTPGYEAPISHYTPRNLLVPI
jgi:hypothetical protein